MVNRRIWKVYITLCFILLCFINTCNGTSRMEIQPLKFTYIKSNPCPNDRRSCNGNEQIKSACRPVFGFQPYYQDSDIDGCTPVPSGFGDIYCPLCKNTNPLTDLNSDALKDQSPLIFYNSTKMPVALFTLITYGDKGLFEKLQQKCIYFKEFTSANNLDITKTINSSCNSLDYRISISCEKYFYGDKCDIECHPSKDNSTEHFICIENGTRICGPGWRGQNCTEVDYCSYSPCENNGTCHNISPYYECRCTPEFTGHNCTKTTFTTESIPTDEVPSTDFSPTLPSSTGCINQHCSEESTVPTKKVTSVSSDKKSTEQARNKALPTTTVAIAGASGGGGILIIVIGVVCIIR